MESELNIKLYSIVIDCPDPRALAEFYARLTGWQLAFYTDEYAVIAPPGSAQGAYPGITFQLNPDYIPPVWPEAPGKQQQMEHLDFAVNDLEAAQRHALECGASKAPVQFSEDWMVMLDPVGHPFCLCNMKSVMESPGFGLR